MASWITEGTAHRSRVSPNPVRHLLVRGSDSGWVLWCSSGKGREDYNPHGTKFCPNCRELAVEAISEGTLTADDVHGWPVEIEALAEVAGTFTADPDSEI